MRLSPLMLIIFLAIFCSPAITAYRLISFVDKCPQDGCTKLEDQTGELQINFSKVKVFARCALVFAATHNKQVFLRIVDDPIQCREVELHIYDGRTYATKSELSVGGICTHNNYSASRYKYRSFMTSGRDFSIVLERRWSLRSQWGRISFTVYYRAFDEEDTLIQDICRMCHENKTTDVGMEVCEGLLPNCTGIAQVIKGSCLDDIDDEKKRNQRTETFAILMSAAVILTIIFVALHCGCGENKSPKAPVEPGRQSSTLFSGRGGGGGRKPGPVGHV